MSRISRIEIAAKCIPDNQERKSMIQSLPTTLTFILWKHNDTTTQETINFDDKAILENSDRYAIILTKENLNWSIEGIKAIETNWVTDETYGNNGHFYVHLSWEDKGYDHILTDVRHNNRSLNISNNTYSVCSCIANGSNYVGAYITLHVE